MHFRDYPPTGPGTKLDSPMVRAEAMNRNPCPTIPRLLASFPCTNEKTKSENKTNKTTTQVRAPRFSELKLTETILMPRSSLVTQYVVLEASFCLLECILGTGEGFLQRSMDLGQLMDGSGAKQLLSTCIPAHLWDCKPLTKCRGSCGLLIS